MSEPSLLQRLKERKLVQWAVAYLAGVWVLFEVSDAVGGRWNLPDVLFQGLFVLLAIGFFITLILAWYHGEKGRQRVSGPELLMVAALLVVAGVALSVLGEPQGDDVTLPVREGDDRPGVAVLPCANMSTDPDDEYLAASLHDEILLKLQKISSLFSIGRTSVLQFADDPPAINEIASDLGVGFVGECSVQKYGNQIRLIFQLLDGRTGGQLWAEDFDQTLTLTNLLDLQSEIAQQVAHAIGALLTPEEKARIESKPTESLQAYDLYLLGRSYFNQLNEAGFERAIELFEQAIAIDPGFAQAYAGIADSYAVLTMGWGRPPVEVFPRVREAAEEALRLDPTLPEAHASLGVVRLLYEWKVADAEAAFRKAIELDPNSANARHWLALCSMSRARHEEALEEIHRALALDPLSPHINLNVGYVLYVAGDHQGAVDHYQNVLKILPNHPLLHAFRGVAQAQLGNLAEAIADLERGVELAGDDNLIPLPYLGYVYGLAGREADARRVLQQLHDLDREQFVNPDYFSIVHLGLGELDQAMEWLYKAQEARTDWAFFFPVDPVAYPLHSDPRFVELVRNNGLGEALR